MPYIPQFQMTGTSLFSAYASLIGMLMLVRTMLNSVIPDELRGYLIKAFHSIFKKSGPDQLTLTVDQHFGHNQNHVYEAAEAYLRTIINSAVDRLKVGKTRPQKKFTISIEKGQEIVDTYMGMLITWKYVLKESQKESGGRQISPYQFGSDPYHFEIVFEKKLKDMVLGAYLPYVMDQFEQIKNEKKVVRMFTREGAGGGRFHHHDENPPWSSVSLKHPVTFDKLAMEHDLKKMIIDDLDQFVSRKEFYQRVGKAWKRGYLLYGLPGTGKSSLIAAMANYLKFDIYDLQLSRIHSDSQLRNILMSIPNRSILIMEDIDCSVELHRGNVTLSGFLNFIDGLWSSCGDELIIVFTTNHKEKLDPALLRPGRMDVQIHMSYCTPAGFKILASNYLDIEDTHHPLFQEIEGLIIPAKVTPAEIAEELTRSEDPDTVLNSVLSLLKQKINEQSRVSVSQNQSISYCTPAGFKNLASDHLDDIEDSDTHSLFEEIESLIIPAKVTPAEVVDELTRSEDPEAALDGVLSLLKRKLTEQQAQISDQLIQKLARNTA